MRRFLIYLCLLMLLGGCSWGEFQVPRQEYQRQVQVLGVLPLLVDRTGPLEYPYRETLYDLIARANIGKHEKLVERLRKKKGYFDVRALSANPDLLALSLLKETQPRDKQGRPAGFNLDRATITELAKRNVVDALLVVVFTGAQVEETRRARNLLESLQTRYSELLATAAVVSADGEILWQLDGADSYQALVLQYPDFDEAYYNRTDLVKVKDISLAGVERAIEEKAEKTANSDLPKLYDELFSRIANSLSPGLLDVLR